MVAADVAADVDADAGVDFEAETTKYAKTRTGEQSENKHHCLPAGTNQLVIIYLFFQIERVQILCLRMRFGLLAPRRSRVG